MDIEYYDLHLWKTNGATGETSQFLLSKVEILLMWTLLFASDITAALSMISYEKHPKLFGLLSGESLVNSAVAIALFNSLSKLGNNDLYTSSIQIVICEFLLLFFLSLMIGFFYGVLASLILKIFKYFMSDAITECIVLVGIAYVCYLTAERLNQSGLLALLTCGGIMASYAWYNLSP